MGCSVNGPGEAKEADLGIVGAKEGNLFYKKGEIVGRIEEKDVIDKLMQKINKK